jgi:ATP-binding cassette subfamily C protein
MLSSVRLALSFLSPRERVSYFSLVVARALTGLLDVFGILLIGVVASVAAISVASDSGPRTSPSILGFHLPQVDDRGLLLLVVLVLVVFVVKAVIAILLTRALAFFVASVEAKSSLRIADYLLRESLDSVKLYSKAEIQFALTGSTTYAFTGLLNNVATLASEGFLLIVITSTLFLVDAVVAVFALIYFALVVVIIQVFIGRSLKKAGQDAVAGTVDTINSLSDTLDTFREIAVLQKQALFIDRIHGSRTKLAHSDAIRTFIAGMPRYVVETSLMLGVVALVGVQFLTGQLAGGLVVVGVFLTGGVRIMASLLPLQSGIANIKQNVEQAQLALSLLDLARTSAAEKDAEALTREVGAPVADDAPLALSVQGVNYRYPGDDHDTLHDVSFEVAAGANVAIVGPSGAGKTTAVDLILGLSLPDSGTVTIGGVQPVDVRTRFPGLVSYVPQKPGLVSGSIAENIALGVPAEEIDYSRIDEVIEAAYLRDFVASLPQGVATSVGKQVDSLSGGQIQRIGVARALYPRPRFLILDEATSGLDAGSEAYVAKSLRDLHGEVTVMVIAHRLSTVQHSDVVYVIEDGRITASGDFKTVRASVPMVAEYVRLMSFEDPE